jgi:molybdenum cofactor biosynthesis protein B
MTATGNSGAAREFKPLNIAVMTVSDTRTEANDTSGAALVKLLTEAGHRLAESCIVPDDVYQVRAVLSKWIADPAINAVITTGGTGITGRDSTPEAVRVLLDKEIEGFGEVFRAVSYEEINTSTIQSRALAGVANATFLFCLPGSTGACRTGWGKIISQQLDYRTRPCNLVELLPRVLGKG